MTKMTDVTIKALPSMPKDPREAEILYTNTIDNISSVFSTVLGDGGFTGKQSTLFQFVAMLICAAGGNIRDMKLLLEKDGIEKYKQYIPKLPHDAREFFKPMGQFTHPKQYADTKQELFWRLDKLLSRTAFARMFTQEKTIDFFSLLDSPRCIVVDTDKPLMGSGVELFGRTILSMILSAAQRRLTQPAHKRLDTFVYVDEANEYIKHDENIEEAINKARKLRVSFTFSHPSPDDIKNPTVRAALGRCGSRFTASGHYHFTYEARDQQAYRITSPPVKRPKIAQVKSPKDYVYHPIPESHRLTYQAVRALPAPEEDDIKPR